MKFLVIDDDISVCVLLVALLSPYGKCETSTSIEVAFEIFTEGLEKNKYDVIFYDMSMTNCEGVDLMSVFRAYERTYNIKKTEKFKLIIISAEYDQEEVERHITDNCADYFIKKPINSTLLYSILETVCSI